MSDPREREPRVAVDASTLTGAPADEPPGPSLPAFPAAGWDRYSGRKFLGQGGMGQVFLAFDHRLRREVAIKFVHGDNPEHVRRLVVEARAQARVRDPRVCEVHEVGEVGGKVYIAMQYIDGTPLGELAGRLTVEEKVMLVRGAAEGIHEAHRAGIIHRDIKPSNILVARGAEGALRPYVMDFGLARAVQDEGMTLSGTVLGTPRYMAPEQARGPASGLDRRADVYSLGATLYHLVTGEPPILGDSVMEVVHNLLTVEPRPPRAIDPDIPADLEAIVIKCLERDRSARYDSARALADDLGRFLDGEPVAARAAGAWYRLRKRIARHRRLVAAGAAATALLLASLGWGLETRREAGRREELARRFAESAERIEAMARYSALSPAHDVRGDREAMRGRMTALDGEIRRAGAAAAGSGHYALGRGYLALGDDGAARAELESAWRSGFREPRAAYALALVMGRLYRQNLLAAERIEGREAREAREREIERQYRDPALTYLAASRGAEAPSTRYAAALVAFYQGRLDQALGHLDAIGGGLPWFYEAPELRGDILFARALGARNRGEGERALRDFEAARRAYAAAAEVGESVPAVHRSVGELEYAAMVMELYTAGDVQPPFERAVAAATRALALAPDDPASLVLRARAYRSMAEHRANQGSKVDDLLASAIADARRAVELDPAGPEARLELSRIFRQWGEVRQARQEDPSAQLGQAALASEGIRAEDRDGSYYGNLGLVYKIWADYEDQVGADSQANRGKAIDAYTRALRLDDKRNDVWINLGINYYARASQPKARDPDDDLAQAVRALERATAINPRHVAPFFYRGEIHLLRARRERARGGDPGPHLARALEAYRGGMAMNPRLPHFHNGVGSVLVEQARDAWDRGADPDPLLDQARAAFEGAIAAAPEQGLGDDNVGGVMAQRARFQAARGQDPSESVRAAVAAVKRALERIPEQSSFWADLGMAHAIQAAFELERGRDPRGSLAQAEAAIRKALARNPSDAVALRYLGETSALRARLRASQGRGRTEEFEEAARRFEKAIDVAPDEGEHALALGHLCREWAAFLRASGADPAPAVQRGLALAGRLLSVRPGWPDALVLEAGLLLEQARFAGGDARAPAARAAGDLARAFSINRALEPVWGKHAELARRIASAPP